mgnify:CR=1 FL=1
MLKLENITKIYESKNFKQKALNNVNLSFRKSEFVSILGPSGSGKTTLLNIIGGLDKYTSGDLIIEGVSTKNYKDSSWDAYRNKKVGFVFQNYNLIPHQTILSNVALALTISGMTKKERIKKAKKALEDVGLKEHINKKPTQLSGGQMQRVAIARALVTNPDIILADEPTGALDSETSLQIMKILKNISKEKLVIMVTHNNELASLYSDRIISLKDGIIINDTNPYIDEMMKAKVSKIKNKSMSFFTSLSLSFNNLLTKKFRTMLVSFAGSIGIIGIALILSLSSGATNYINKTERETLSSYPITISKNETNYSLIMQNANAEVENKNCKKNTLCTYDDISTNPYIQKSNYSKINNLKKFKSALDDNIDNINNYVLDIKYSYNVNLEIYNYKTQKKVSSIINNYEASIFSELIDNNDLINEQYDLLYGKYPEKYNELVLIVDENNQIPLSIIYALDLIENFDINEYLNKKEKTDININYENIVNEKYKLLITPDYYEKNGGIWEDKSNDKEYINKIMQNKEDISIVGILKVKNESVNASSGYIGYTKALANYIISKTLEKDIVKEQLQNKNINVLTKQNFDDSFTYDDICTLLGISDIDNPSKISIYPKDFEAKEKIEDILNKYNESASEEDKIMYTDFVKILMSGINTIINVITYILVAFVAISLVVSSIMIAIITYISVLERTKEIGILRAIGASKKDISRIFNAETIIEGAFAGSLGIFITLLLNKVVDKIVYNLSSVANITYLSFYACIVLIFISIFLSFIAGLIPAKIASKKDPVISLRSE